MEADSNEGMMRVRQAYELGRLRTSTVRALMLLVPVALVVYVVTGWPALTWLPFTFVAWLFAHWRGGAVLRGASFGLVAGAVTYLLPMSILRPCCSPAMMAVAGRDCCTMPGACLAAGGLVGVVLAAFVPSGPARLQSAAGMALGVASLAILRCSTLFLGEAIGLVGGLLAGLLAVSYVRAVALR